MKLHTKKINFNENIHEDVVISWDSIYKLEPDYVDGNNPVLRCSYHDDEKGYDCVIYVLANEMEVK